MKTILRTAPTSKPRTARLRRTGCDPVRNGSHRNSQDAVRFQDLPTGKPVPPGADLADKLVEVASALARVVEELALVAWRLRMRPAGLDSESGAASGDRARVQGILDRVCVHYGVTPAQVFARSKLERFVWPRFVAVYLSSRLVGLSTTELGRIFSRDHGTIVHALRAARNRMETEPRLREEVNALEAEVLAHGHPKRPKPKEKTGSRQDPGLKTPPPLCTTTMDVTHLPSTPVFLKPIPGPHRSGHLASCMA